MLLELKHLPEARHVIEAYSDHIHAEVATWDAEDKTVAPSQRCDIKMVMRRYLSCRFAS